VVGGSGGARSGLLAAVHRTVRSGPPWGTGPHSGQLRPEMVSRTLVMISAGIGA
jgi:hypothetical protein